MPAHSGRSFDSPRSADRNTLASAAASRLDAAYGRSLTNCPSVKPSRRPVDSRIGSTSRSRVAVHRSGLASGKNRYAVPVDTSELDLEGVIGQILTLVVEAREIEA